MCIRRKIESRVLLGLRALAMAAVLGSGCGASRRAQLERVAKDWCETIRASQVIPVYPPTADLLPGDMFLVDRSVREQHAEWNKKGFLALPFELPRLPIEQLPPPEDRYAPSRWAMLDSEAFGTKPSASRKAPSVVFPAYSFRFDRRGSFSLSLPFGGVPVGMAASASRSATGTVVMKGVKTFGYDSFVLSERVRAFWSQTDQAAFLKAIKRQSPDEEVFLRVVSRVYAVREFNIAIFTKSSLAADRLAASLSAPKSTALIERVRTPSEFPDAGTTGTLGVQSEYAVASSRSVTLNDLFDEPIVVGYLGFDMRVSMDGRLGVPVPTFRVLDQAVVPKSIGPLTHCQDRFIQLREFALANGLAERVFPATADALGPPAREQYKFAILGGASRKAALGSVFSVLNPGLAQTGPRASETAWCELAGALEDAIFASRPERLEHPIK